MESVSVQGFDFTVVQCDMGGVEPNSARAISNVVSIIVRKMCRRNLSLCGMSMAHAIAVGQCPRLPQGGDAGDAPAAEAGLSVRLA
jgi:hypothetical protein